MSTEIFNKKKEKSTWLKKELGLKEKYKPLWLIKLNNKEIIKDLRDGLLTINAWFVLEVAGVEKEKIWDNIVVVSNITEAYLLWFDFIVCDDGIENIELYLEAWIVPIIEKENHLSSILTEFNPMKNEGNSYFYDTKNKWLIFAAIIRYMENYKFPFDNKNLVKNVLKA
jgi:hypothetical protein